MRAAVAAAERIVGRPWITVRTNDDHCASVPRVHIAIRIKSRYRYVEGRACNRSRWSCDGEVVSRQGRHVYHGTARNRASDRILNGERLPPPAVYKVTPPEKVCTPLSLDVKV